ncbi:P-loop containing nucleoside triphosphate hydrolase protein [Cyathus striatus]|nr:P-loop containing nucleoside triphosphate hydrolase protein [Cyathus striatus]
MERSQRYGDKKQLAPIPEHTSKISRPHTLYDGALKRGTSRQGKPSTDSNAPYNRQKKDPRGRKTASLPARPVYHYKLITHQDLKPDDIIIAVMGASGCGKSTFISKATGYEAGVGHSLEPCTTKIHMVKITSSGFNNPDIVLVDTPGFHDSPTHLKQLQSVSKHLTPSGSKAKRHQLSGLLYFHRMTDNRIREAFPIHDLEVFPELISSGVFKNVSLVTTMWDSIEKEIGEQREDHLCRRYWRAMSDRRSHVLRFQNTRESAWSILRPIIQKTRDQERRRSIGKSYSCMRS